MIKKENEREGEVAKINHFLKLFFKYEINKNEERLNNLDENINYYRKLFSVKS